MQGLLEALSDTSTLAEVPAKLRRVGAGRDLENLASLDPKILVAPKHGWWFRSYFSFSPRSLGKVSNLTHIFQMGWFNHQPVVAPKHGWLVQMNFLWRNPSVSRVEDRFSHIPLDR